jgi:hypothetical protein
MESICAYDCPAYTVHRVVEREHPHFEIGHFQRYHRDLKDGLVEPLGPVDIRAGYFEPADRIFHVGCFIVINYYTFFSSIEVMT